MDQLKEISGKLLAFTQMNLETLFLWLTGISLLTFALSLVLLPYLVRKIPSNYFLQLSKEQPTVANYRAKHLLLYLIRNIFGFFLLISGIAMLFLPGQGLITIFIALLLLDFPLKRRVIIYLVSLEKIQTAINWIRKKSKSKPVQWPTDSE